MPYISGKNAKLFMTTENPSAVVVLTGSTASAGASSSTIGVATTTAGVGVLGAVTDTSSVGHMMKFVEGIDYNPDFEDDSYKPFGVDMEQNVPMRKTWQLTITRKADGGMFRKAFGNARFGVQASNSLHDGTAQFDNTVGYRFYIYNGSDWILLMHGIFDTGGYAERIDSSRLNVETLKFKGNYWLPAAATADLTASVNL